MLGWVGCVFGGSVEVGEGLGVGSRVALVVWVLCWVVGLGSLLLPLSSLRGCRPPPPPPSVVVRLRLRPPPSVVVCPLFGGGSHSTPFCRVVRHVLPSRRESTPLLLSVVVRPHSPPAVAPHRFQVGCWVECWVGGVLGRVMGLVGGSSGWVLGRVL